MRLVIYAVLGRISRLQYCGQCCSMLLVGSICASFVGKFLSAPSRSRGQNYCSKSSLHFLTKEEQTGKRMERGTAQLAPREISGNQTYCNFHDQ